MSRKLKDALESQIKNYKDIIASTDSKETISFAREQIRKLQSELSQL